MRWICVLAILGFVCLDSDACGRRGSRRAARRQGSTACCAQQQTACTTCDACGNEAFIPQQASVVEVIPQPRRMPTLNPNVIQNPNVNPNPNQNQPRPSGVVTPPRAIDRE